MTRGTSQPVGLGRPRVSLVRPLLLALALPLLAGCGGGVTAHYAVDWTARDSTGVPVRLELSGALGDSVAMECDATQSLIALRVIGATGPGGAALPVAFSLRRDVADRDFPRVVVTTKGVDRATVEYRVAVGAREGNAHMGWTGRSFGGAGTDFVFAPGPGLFLIPDPGQRLREASVRFVLPPEWTAVTPWPESGGEWRPGVGGRYVADDLSGAPLAIGRFETVTREMSGTRFRWLVASSIPDSGRARVVAALDTLAVMATRLFGRGLGATYTVIAVPETRDGDDIAHQGWANGSGGTLWPLTATRLHDACVELMDGYIAYPPYRTVIRDPKERWLGEGVRRLYAWRGVERAGLVTEDDIMRGVATDWVNALDDEHVEWNLEAAYQGGDGHGVPPLSAETAAPFSAAALDREVRAASNGATTLDDVLRRAYSGRVARSFWQELPSPHDPRWKRFRAQYARAEQPPIQDPAFTLSQTTLGPTPPRGEPRDHLILAYTGSTYGYLENCGCRVNQAGGMPRRRTALDRLRAEASAVALLDAGNAFPKPERPEPPGFLAREEQGLYFRLMRSMGYGAVAINEAELAYGADYFEQSATGVPFVSANVTAGSAALAPSWMPVRAGSVRLGVIGVLEPARGPKANPVLERRAGAYAFADPVDAVRRVLPEARRSSDLVVALGRLSPWTVRRLITACPDLDVVISSAPEAANRYEDEDEPPSLQPEDQAGFIGRTLVLYSYLGSYGLNSARLGLDADRRIATAETFSHWLDDTVHTDTGVRAELTAFYERVGRAEAATASVPPLFADDPGRMTGTYVGAAACSTCHAPQFAQWHDTPHADAWQTLLDAHRHYQPRCVSCHVVGLGTKAGYTLGDADTRLVNVQCEVCHGPGGEHVKRPSAATIRRAVPEKVCLECHDPEHSDDFVYDSKLPLVVHSSTAPRAGNATSSPNR